MFHVTLPNKIFKDNGQIIMKSGGRRDQSLSPLSSTTNVHFTFPFLSSSLYYTFPSQVAFTCHSPLPRQIGSLMSQREPSLSPSFRRAREKATSRQRSARRKTRGLSGKAMESRGIFARRNNGGPVTRHGVVIRECCLVEGVGCVTLWGGGGISYYDFKWRFYPWCEMDGMKF